MSSGEMGGSQQAYMTDFDSSNRKVCSDAHQPNADFDEARTHKRRNITNYRGQSAGHRLSQWLQEERQYDDTFIAIFWPLSPTPSKTEYHPVNTKNSRLYFAGTKASCDTTTHLSDGALNVSNDGSVGIVDELDSDLDHVTGVASATQHLVHLGELDVLVLEDNEQKQKIREETLAHSAFAHATKLPYHDVIYER